MTKAMAEVGTFSSWEAEGTTVSEVEAALGGLRRKEERAAVRMAALTLVVLLEGENASSILEVLGELGTHHPTHAVVVVAGAAEAEPRLDAEVRVHVVERGDRGVCFESVVLGLQGPAVEHLDSVVAAFLLPDVPVVVWRPGRLPSAEEPLLSRADRVIIDVREWGEADQLGAGVFSPVVALARRLPVTGLSWVRLTPWRELLGGLFEGEVFRPFLWGVRSVEVVGKPGPRHLLAGWLVSRLDLSPTIVRLADARHVSVEIQATHASRIGRFSVTRESDERMVEASAAVEGGPRFSSTLRLRERSPARVLGQALARLGHDRVFESAVAAAATLG